MTRAGVQPLLLLLACLPPLSLRQTFTLAAAFTPIPAVQAFPLPDPVPEDWFGYHLAQSEALRRQRAQGQQPLEQQQQQQQQQQQALPHMANGAGAAQPPSSSSGQLAALGSLLALGDKGSSLLDAPGSPTGPLGSVAAASLWFDEPRDQLPAPTATWANLSSPPEPAAAAACSSSGGGGGSSTQHRAEEEAPSPPSEPPRTPVSGPAPAAPASDLGPDIQVASLVCLKPETQPSELTAAVAAAARAEAAAAAAAAAEAGSESDSWASSSDDVLSSSDDERTPQPPAAHHPQQRWRQRHGSGRLPRSALRLALVGAGQHHHGAAGHSPSSPRRRSAGRRWPMGAADGSRVLAGQPEPASAASTSRLSSRPKPIPSGVRVAVGSCGVPTAAATTGGAAAASEALAVPVPGAECATLAAAAAAGDHGADGTAAVAGGSSEDDEPSFGESWLDEADRMDERRERRLRRAAAAAEEGKDACSVDLSPKSSLDMAAPASQLREDLAAEAAAAAGVGGRHYWEVVDSARQDILSRLEDTEGCQPEEEGQQWGEGQQDPAAQPPPRRRRAPLGSVQAAAAARRQAEAEAAAAAGEGSELEAWEGPSDLAAAAAYLEALAEGNGSEEEEAAAETGGGWVEAAAAAATTEHQAGAVTEAHGADAQAWHDYWQSYYAAYGCYPSADALQQGRAAAAAASQAACVPPPPPVPPPPAWQFDPGWSGALEPDAACGGSPAPSTAVLQAQLRLWQDWQQKYADWCAVWQQFLASWPAWQQEQQQQPQARSNQVSSADNWEWPQVTL